MAELAPYPTLFAPEAMVCAADHLAAGAGAAMLRGGGGPADAAVAAGAVCAVTLPHMCGLGGDLLAVVHPGDGGVPVALDAAGRAGSGADAAQLRAEGRSAMPVTGDARSVTVPGCVDGWLALHRRFGRLPLAEVLEPARVLAEHGFPASPTLAAALDQTPGVPAPDLLAAGAPAPGDRLRRPGTARCLAELAEGGREAFYEGAPGADLLELGRGEYVADDLTRSQGEWVSALSIEAWGQRLWTVPPPSQGYLALSASWMAGGLALPEDPEDPLWAHLLVEVARQAAKDRGDVLHDRADGKALLDPSLLGARRSTVDPERAALFGQGTGAGGTVAVCAMTADGEGVSLLQSNALGFGSLLSLRRSATLLHNRGIGFSLQAGHPAEYAPGRRPPHTLSPVMVTDPDGRLRATLATMGGDSQPQVLLQILARLLGAGSTPAAAVSAGRFALSPRHPARRADRSSRAASGHEHGSDIGASPVGFSTWEARGEVAVALEGHAPPGWASGLAERGHQVALRPPFDHGFGHAQLIVATGGGLAGASDPRPRGGGAAGI